jgi:hypothetical protein
MESPKEGDLGEERERLSSLYDFGLTYSATYSTLIVAAAFGIFGILLLIQAGKKPNLDPSHLVLPIDWIVFSLAYFVALILTMFVYSRTVVYSRFIGIVGRRLASTRSDPKDLAEEIYREACLGPGSNLLTRMVIREYPTLKSTDPMILLPVSAIMFVALWLATSFG